MKSPEFWIHVVLLLAVIVALGAIVGELNDMTNSLIEQLGTALYEQNKNV